MFTTHCSFFEALEILDFNTDTDFIFELETNDRATVFFIQKEIKLLLPISSKSKMSQDLKISKILVAIDGSENSMKAADYAIKLAQRFDGRIIALYVIPPEGKYNPKRLPTKGTKTEYDYLDKVEQKSIQANVKLETDIIASETSVVTEITEYVEKKTIDLVVIGIRRTSEFRFMLGSTASGVVTNAPCPVLVVK